MSWTNEPKLLGRKLEVGLEEGIGELKKSIHIALCESD